MTTSPPPPETKTCIACDATMHRDSLSLWKWKRKSTCNHDCRTAAAKARSPSAATRALTALEHYQLPLTRDELADELSVSRGTLAKHMEALASAGHVERYDGPDGITYRLRAA
ncbi:MAG: winged helix-turn-helix transcriptional regulator [Gemmatimonadaceae bacterium]|nr:winged helix-turn-helix transcriptional regulator [Gemmatimonadaceae bacterium]